LSSNTTPNLERVSTFFLYLDANAALNMKNTKICEKTGILKAPKKTMWSDLYSTEAQKLTDELMRQQLRDIAASKTSNRIASMKYRD